MSKVPEIIKRVRGGEDAQTVIRGLEERGRLAKTLLRGRGSVQSGYWRIIEGKIGRLYATDVEC